MALHSLVYCEGAVDPPLDDVEIVGLQLKRDILGAPEVPDDSRQLVFVITRGFAHSFAQVRYRGMDVGSAAFA